MGSDKTLGFVFMQRNAVYHQIILIYCESNVHGIKANQSLVNAEAWSLASLQVVVLTWVG